MSDELQIPNGPSSQVLLASALRKSTWDTIPPVVMAYVEWLGLPPEARDPETIHEFADEWDVRYKSLLALEAHSQFVDLLAPYKHGMGGVSRMAVRLALERLEERATRPDASLQDIQALLRQAGVLTPEASLSVSVPLSGGAGGDPTRMTTEELLKELEAAGATEAEVADYEIAFVEDET